MEDTKELPHRLSKKELCRLYEVSYSTLKKWLSMVPDLGPPELSNSGFSRKQIYKIYEHLGKPD